MARLIAVADGNNTSAATWALVDSTSYAENEGTPITAPTTYATTYTQFAPGAITIDGIALRVANRTGTTGTFSVELYNHTVGASVAGTEVTVNCSDFVDAITASIDGGWMFFKFAAPTLLIAANNYSVRFKTSNSAQIAIHAASSTNPTRMLRTTTTQAPVAGDDRFVMGEWTAAATTTTRTVTLDDTSVVDYGSASTSQVTPALSVSAGGIVLSGTTASTAYVQKISGNVVVYNGGILRIATSGSRMPTTSSMTWTMDCAANVDFGIDIRRKGEFTAYGETKTRWTLLTGDEAAAQTVIGVADTTGWKTSDELAFAPTGTTISQGEVKNISTVDSGVQVTLTAGLTNAHTGTGDVVGEVANLTSNIRILGTSTSVGTFICFRQSSLGVLDNVECRYLGSSTTNKRGVECQHINTSTNSATFHNSSFRDILQSGFLGCNATNGANYYITNCAIYSFSGSASTLQCSGGGAGTPTFEISENVVIGGGTGIGLSMGLVTGVTGICENNYFSGCTTGVLFVTNFLQDSTSDISGFKIHSNTTGADCAAAIKKTITACDMNCNSNGVLRLSGNTNFVSCNIIGNSISGARFNTVTTLPYSHSVFNSCVFRGRTSFAQPLGISADAVYQIPPRIEFNSCTFGATTAHTTADVSITAVQGCQCVFNNCTFASTTEFNSTIHTFLDENAYVGVQRLDTTAGNHKAFIRQGIITRDTTIFRTASPSLRIEPKSATIAASTHVKPFAVPVNSGQTCTPSVYVRESVVGDGTDYNGNRIKLYVKANYNLGITSDTLLDTATASSEGAFEELTGTTAAATDDGVLEFYITCDGTTGWINIDDFTATAS